MWDKLQATYELTDLAFQVSIYRKLLAVSLHEGNSVVEFLEDFQGLVDETAVSGLVIADNLLIIILSGALPDS